MSSKRSRNRSLMRNKNIRRSPKSTSMKSSPKGKKSRSRTTRTTRISKKSKSIKDRKNRRSRSSRSKSNKNTRIRRSRSNITINILFEQIKNKDDIYSLKKQFYEDLSVDQTKSFSILPDIIENYKMIFKIYQPSEKNKLEKCYLIIIQGRSDNILIKLANLYNFPRGFPIIWIPKKSVQLFGFYPKFENDQRDSVEDNVDNSEFKNIEKMSFNYKYSGFLGIICPFVYEGKNYWTVCSKNGTNSIYTNDIIRIMNKKITRKLLRELIQNNYHLCGECLSKNDQKHGAKVLKEEFVITGIGIANKLNVQTKTTTFGISIDKFPFVRFVNLINIMDFCVKHNLAVDNIFIVKNPEEFMNRLQNIRNMIDTTRMDEILYSNKNNIEVIKGTISHINLLGEILEGIIIKLSYNNGTHKTIKYKFPIYTVRTFFLRKFFDNYSKQWQGLQKPNNIKIPIGKLSTENNNELLTIIDDPYFDFYYDLHKKDFLSRWVISDNILGKEYWNYYLQELYTQFNDLVKTFDPKQIVDIHIDMLDRLKVDTFERFFNKNLLYWKIDIKFNDNDIILLNEFLKNTPVYNWNFNYDNQNPQKNDISVLKTNNKHITLYFNNNNNNILPTQYLIDKFGEKINIFFNEINYNEHISAIPVDSPFFDKYNKIHKITPHITLAIKDITKTKPMQSTQMILSNKKTVIKFPNTNITGVIDYVANNNIQQKNIPSNQPKKDKGYYPATNQKKGKIIFLLPVATPGVGKTTLFTNLSNKINKDIETIIFTRDNIGALNYAKAISEYLQNNLISIKDRLIILDRNYPPNAFSLIKVGNMYLPKELVKLDKYKKIFIELNKVNDIYFVYLDYFNKGIIDKYDDITKVVLLFRLLNRSSNPTLVDSAHPNIVMKAYDMTNDINEPIGVLIPNQYMRIPVNKIHNLMLSDSELLSLYKQIIQLYNQYKNDDTNFNKIYNQKYREKVENYKEPIFDIISQNPQILETLNNLFMK